MDLNIQNKIKLPLLKFCISGAAVLCILTLLSDVITKVMFLIIYAVIILAWIFCVILFPKNRSFRLVLVSSFIAVTLFNFYHFSYYNPAKKIYGRQENIVFEALEDTVHSDDYSYVYGRASIEGRLYRIILYPKGDKSYKAGEIINTNVKIYFAKSSYLLGQGILLKAYEKEYIATLGTDYDSIRFLPYKTRKYINAISVSIYGEKESTGLILGLLTGDRTYVSEESKNAFSLSGTSHIMAVSGMHMSVILAFIMFLFGRKWGSIFGIPIIMLYCGISGFSPSAMRAVIMSSIGIIAFLFKREYHVYTAFFLAAYALIASNPYVIYNLSFLLSFLSVFGIIVFMPLFTEKIKSICYNFKVGKGLIYFILSSLAISFSATVFTSLVLFAYFTRVSTISAIANIFVVVPSTILMCMVFSNLFVGLFSVELAKLFGRFLIIPLSNGILYIVNKMASLPLSSVKTDNVFFLVSWLILIVCSLIYFKKKKHFIALTAIVATSFIIGMRFSYVYYKDICIIDIVKVNTTAMAYIHDNEGAILIGGGDGKDGRSSRYVESCMFENMDNHINMVFISKMNKANITGAITLKENYGCTVYGSDYTRNLYTLEYIRYTEQNISVNNVDVKPINLPYNESVLSIKIKDKTILWLPAIANKRLNTFLDNDIKANIAVISDTASYDDLLVEKIFGIEGLEKLVIVNKKDSFIAERKDIDILETAAKGKVRLEIKGGK